MFKRSWLRLAAALMLLPFLLLPTGCGSSRAQAALISACQGDAQYKKAGSTSWTAAQAGQALAENDMVSTGTGSGMTVTFFDGSTIELKPDTRVEIQDLAAGKTTAVRLQQEIGQTWSKVTRLVDQAGRYEIETPAAVAAVRGSQMIVEVVADGTTSVGNVEGEIIVTAQGEEVTIPEGQHCTVVPGSSPGEPEAGTTAVMISSPVYQDAAGDHFNSQGQPAAGPDYLDIQSSQVSYLDGKWVLRMDLKDRLPSADTVAAGSLTEWNFLLDLDRDRNTGLSRPFISNDIGYDWLGQLALENQAYTGRFYDLIKRTSEAVEFTINQNRIELILPAVPGQAASPPTTYWGVAAIHYRAEDPRDTPFLTDKAPDSGHYLFEDVRTAAGLFAEFSTGKTNPNGAWSYGWMPVDFSTFHLYTEQADNAFNAYRPEGLVSWYTTLGMDRTPCIWCNPGETAYGAPSGWLSLHPGPGQEPSVLRWTAPRGGRIKVSGEFLQGDPGKMTVAVRHNGQEVWGAGDGGQFDLVLEAVAGDTLDFLAYGGYHYGNTPLRVDINYPG